MLEFERPDPAAVGEGMQAEMDLGFKRAWEHHAVEPALIPATEKFKSGM